MPEGLQTIVAPGPDLEQLERLSSAELIDHILRHYHEVHLRDLPLAIDLARRVEQSEHWRPECPRGLERHLQEMLLDLRSHQQKEECILFPLLAQGARGVLHGPLARMSVEHSEVLDQLDVLAHLTGRFCAPPGASKTWRELYSLCAKIASELRAHMVIEEEILFPRGR